MLAYSPLYPRSNAYRRAESLDGLWRFRFDPKGEGFAQGWHEKGLPGAVSMPVPASFSDLFTAEEERDYCGDFWYETSFSLPAYQEGRRLYIRFGSITHRARVYCNGILVAEHEGGYLPIVADITHCANIGGDNLLVVQANNELSYETLPCGKTVTLKSGRKIASPGFDFFNYAGIHRSVWLVSTAAVALQDYSLSYAVRGSDAAVSYSADILGEGSVTAELFDAEGRLVASAEGAEGVLQVKDAQLWRVRKAYLYTLRFGISAAGATMDEYSEKIGIRTVELRGEEILISGEAVYLKGYGRHEDFDVMGKAFNWAVAKRDFELMKWNNANCFRTSHYPYAEEWYQMADEEGFLIIDEVAAVGMMEWDQPFVAVSGRSEKLPFFAGPHAKKLKENHLRQVEEMIARDKNHPSVFSWSLLNEPDAVSEEAREYFTDIFAHARSLDREGRPMTGALELSANDKTCSIIHLMDYICLNRYYGWYEKGGAEFEDAMIAFRTELDGWKALGLNVPFVMSEFGADTLAGEHSLPAVMWTQEYQDKYYSAYFEIFKEYSFIKGELIWNFADFQTAQHIRRVVGNKKGVFTRSRQPKNSAYLLRDHWAKL